MLLTGCLELCALLLLRQLSHMQRAARAPMCAPLLRCLSAAAPASAAPSTSGAPAPPVPRIKYKNHFKRSVCHVVGMKTPHGVGDGLWGGNRSGVRMGWDCVCVCVCAVELMAKSTSCQPCRACIRGPVQGRLSVASLAL